MGLHNISFQICFALYFVIIKKKKLKLKFCFKQNFNTDVAINSCLPCCSKITNQKIYYCHEDLSTNFYRLLDVIKLQDIVKISYDETCQYFCIIVNNIKHFL
jgi:hypothetical protein